MTIDRDQLVAVALGEQPADLAIMGGKLVNVYSGEIYPADLAIAGKRIAAVGEIDYCIGPKTKRVDAAGRYLVPGLIETHIHVGATSLIMTEFARLVVPLGTAVIVTDFTEAGKMQGVKAMRFFLDETAKTPLKAYFSPFYTTSLGIDGRFSMSIEEMREIIKWPEIIELREWNIFVERSPNEELRQLGSYAQSLGVSLCGHMEGQSGKLLQASVVTGAHSDHEAGSAQGAIERARLGVAVQMRFSSAGDDMQYLLQAVTEHHCDPRLFMFSTDEEDIDDIARLGHIDHRIRVAISSGVAPIDAIRMGCLNPAVHLGITGDYGSLTPGRIAFVNLVDNLRAFNISNVVYGTEVVAEGSQYIGDLQKPELPKSFYNTVSVKSPVMGEAFEIKAPEGATTATVRVIGVNRGVVRTEERILEIPVREGEFRPDPDSDIAKIAVVERHVASGKVGMGLIQGIGLNQGAFGSSYHPGPIHISVVGADEADMALVVERIAELQGGFVAVLDGKVLAEAPLPILGFLSEAPAEQVVVQFKKVKAAIAEDLGADFEGLFTTLAYVCIPGVEPDLRMSVNGLVKVEYSDKELSIKPISIIV